MTVRFAVPEDAPDLLAIYEHYIQTSATFEYTLPTPEEFAERIRSIRECYPYLVACGDDGRPIGYAYAHRAWERAAYSWNAELSAYLAPEAAGHGLGQQLCRMLLALLRRQGVRSAYGVVTQPNPASTRLHEALGFHPAARLHRVGYKDGAWHDVVWYEKEIAPHGGAPEPLRTIWQLPEAEVAAILQGKIGE